MVKHVLLIHGAGGGSYDADKHLAASLRQSLGPGYVVRYPEMPDEEHAPYDLWTQVIERELAAMPGAAVLVGHSIGASTVMQWLSNAEVRRPLAGIFLLATPFWGGDGWRYEGYQELELPAGFGARFPRGVPLFLYHCRGDEVVPFAHLGLYAERLPQATVRALDGCGHQFNDDLSAVADDIAHLPA